MKVKIEHSAQMAAMRECGSLMSSIVQKFKKLYSTATIYRHAAKKIGNAEIVDRRSGNRGRPRLLTVRERRRILRAIPKLRNLEGSFSSRRVAVFAGVEKTVSNRTVRRVLRSAGYGFFVCRKKGLMTPEDRAKRVKFCRKVSSLNRQDFWKNNVSMYLDGTGFQYKTRPLDQARAPKAREWRLRSEGLKVTAKGQKEGTTNANFMVGISYGKGVVLCEQYRGSITGEKFAKIVTDDVSTALTRIGGQHRRVLQDGCPRQNSKVARKAFENINSLVFKIPPRSPDLNPIENFFHNVKRKLKRDVIDENIETESFEEFSLRVKNTMLMYPVAEIDRIIDSMDKRVELILQSGGYRCKY